jgi:hypothetical protein
VTNRYEVAGAALLMASRVEVARYRKRTTGVAWEENGRMLIECPRPRGPVSFCTMAHEIAHHLLNHVCQPKLRPRWVEETEAWDWALEALARFDLPGIERAEADAERCLAYAYAKAIRRGVAPAVIEHRFPGWWSRTARMMHLVYVPPV